MAVKQGKNKGRDITWVCGLIFGAFITLLFLLIIINLTGSRLIGKKTYQYYQGLDSRYGKYYSLENIIEKKALKKAKRLDLDSVLLPYLIRDLNDDYAEYFTKEEYEEFERKYLESYSGIGVLIEETDNKIYIVDVIRNSPADKANIPVGSIIKNVDGKKADNIHDVSEQIRGKTGTKVKLECEYGGKLNKYSLIRDNIDDSGVESKVYDKAKNIGYVKLSGFKNGTASILAKDIDDLKKQGCDKIIIDLRGNTGGVMQEGIDCADVILPKADIVKVKERQGKMKVYSSDAKNSGIKCVLLVDEYTASASEIFAYAVKDNKAGKLVGKRTFGKGVIQGIYDLRDGSKFKLTIAEYFSPKGHKINKIGIEPDVECDTSGDECLVRCVEVLDKE